MEISHRSTSPLKSSPTVGFLKDVSTSVKDALLIHKHLQDVAIIWSLDVTEDLNNCIGHREQIMVGAPYYVRPFPHVVYFEKLIYRVVEGSE